MEILNKKLTSIVKIYRVTLDTDKGNIELDIHIEDEKHIIERSETVKTDVWHKLSHEEKEEIDEILDSSFILNE